MSPNPTDPPDCLPACEAAAKQADGRGTPEGRSKDIEALQAELQATRTLARQAVDKARQELLRLQHQLSARDAKVARMQSSFSWKITAPLRALRRLTTDHLRGRTAAGPAEPAKLVPVDFNYHPRDFNAHPSGLLLGIDFPRTWRSLTGQVQIRGWCLSPLFPLGTEVRARIAGKEFIGAYGLPRPDVQNSYPNIPASERSGFALDVELVTSGDSIVLEVRHASHGWVWMKTIKTSLDAEDDYSAWVGTYDTLTSAGTEVIRQRLSRLRQAPLISVLMPVYDTPDIWLRKAIDSVRGQLYENWELCIADDASRSPHVRKVLEDYARKDRRIKVTFRPKNGHISAASNSALELATGDFVALLDHDDELAPHALAFVALTIDRYPDATFVYSDEDKIGTNGERHTPYFKPDWNPDLLRSQNYICHLAVYRRSLVCELGGFREGLEGAQDWDLALRVSERCRDNQIHHIPRILYHWRAIAGSTATDVTEKPYVDEAGRRALSEHLERIRLPATVAPVPGHYWRTHYETPQPAPKVTLLIPTRNKLAVLQPCITSILEKTQYPNFEILILDNDSDEPETLTYLHTLQDSARCRVLKVPGPFNFSAINNAGARATDAPVLALLNNDLEVISPGWLSELVAHALRPGTGCAGPKLYYPDGRIQHAGVILGIGGMAGHIWCGWPRNTTGMGYRACLQQNFTALTAACLVVRKDIYESVGGLDEDAFQIGLNDVDFCLRVSAAGFRNVYVPGAELYHHESVSRGYDEAPEKKARLAGETKELRNRWHQWLENDPAYNPNLSLETVNFDLAFPPRVRPLTQLDATWEY